MPVRPIKNDPNMLRLARKVVESGTPDEEAMQGLRNLGARPSELRSPREVQAEPRRVTAQAHTRRRPGRGRVSYSCRDAAAHHLAACLRANSHHDRIRCGNPGLVKADRPDYGRSQGRLGALQPHPATGVSPGEAGLPGVVGSCRATILQSAASAGVLTHLSSSAIGFARVRQPKNRETWVFLKDDEHRRYSRRDPESGPSCLPTHASINAAMERGWRK
jgi:hypothetical protein